MATHYINTIRSFLKEFQPGLSQEIYNSLAWTGLKNTTAWNALSPSERIKITDTINDFNGKESENCRL